MIRHIITCVLGFISIGHSVLMAVPYTVMDLGTLGGPRSEAFDINSAGVVVGFSFASLSDIKGRAFRYANGQMQDLGDLPGFSGGAVAHAINDSDQIVGNYNPTSSGVRAFLWTEGLGMQDIVGVNSRARGINSSGKIVGWNDVNSFIWDQGAITSLDIPVGSTQIRAEDISDLDQVVGALVGGSNNSFLWKNGVTTEFNGGSGQAINNLDEIVGGSLLLRNVFGNWIGQTFPVDGIRAFDINDSSQVVGRIGVASNSDSRAFVWTESGGVIDLNSLINPTSEWLLTDARGINNIGQIVGWGISPSGDTHAFLLHLLCGERSLNPSPPR